MEIGNALTNFLIALEMRTGLLQAWLNFGSPTCNLFLEERRARISVLWRKLTWRNRNLSNHPVILFHQSVSFLLGFPILVEIFCYIPSLRFGQVCHVEPNFWLHDRPNIKQPKVWSSEFRSFHSWKHYYSSTTRFKFGVNRACVFSVSIQIILSTHLVLRIV